MVLDHDENDPTVTWVRIPLDPKTADRLNRLADFCHAQPVSVASSLLHDILKDDEVAHEPSHRAVAYN